VLAEKVLDKLLKQKVAEKFGQDMDKIKIEQEQVKVKELSEKKKEVLKNLKESKKYYISKKSNILHVANCPYGKNIKKGNKIILKSLEGTGNLKRCRCMTD
jgi:L-lactate utilization protein LutC